LKSKLAGRTEKFPNQGHILNSSQKAMSQRVRIQRVYCIWMALLLIFL